MIPDKSFHYILKLCKVHPSSLTAAWMNTVALTPLIHNALGDAQQPRHVWLLPHFMLEFLENSVCLGGQWIYSLYQILLLLRSLLREFKGHEYGSGRKEGMALISSKKISGGLKSWMPDRIFETERAFFSRGLWVLQIHHECSGRGIFTPGWEVWSCST